MALCVVTLNDLAQATQRAETQLIHDGLTRAALQIRSQKIVTAGTIIGEKGVVLGTWVYTPSAGTPG